MPSFIHYWDKAGQLQKIRLGESCHIQFQIQIPEIETKLLFCVYLFIVLIIMIHLVLDLTAVLLAL